MGSHPSVPPALVRRGQQTASFKKLIEYLPITGRSDRRLTAAFPWVEVVERIDGTVYHIFVLTGIPGPFLAIRFHPKAPGVPGWVASGTKKPRLFPISKHLVGHPPPSTTPLRRPSSVEPGSAAPIRPAAAKPGIRRDMPCEQAPRQVALRPRRPVHAEEHCSLTRPARRSSPPAAAAGQRPRSDSSFGSTSRRRQVAEL